MIFGGWCNFPTNDIYAINIGKITGPEYAIYQISPKLGSLAGKTKCEIKGEGFKPNLHFSIRFILNDSF